MGLEEIGLAYRRRSLMLLDNAGVSLRLRDMDQPYMQVEMYTVNDVVNNRVVKRRCPTMGELYPHVDWEDRKGSLFYKARLTTTPHP